MYENLRWGLRRLARYRKDGSGKGIYCRTWGQIAAEKDKNEKTRVKIGRDAKKLQDEKSKGKKSTRGRKKEPRVPNLCKGACAELFA